MVVLQTWLVTSLFSGVVLGQTGSNAFNNVQLCNQTFADANATGFYTYDPQVDQGKQQLQPNNTSGKSLPLDVAFTLTVDTNASQLVSTTWINPNNANFSDNFGLGYDVCAMALSPFPNNTIRRGQSDNGSCYEMFDEPCVTALNEAAQDYALQLTLNPTSGSSSNLTQNSIYDVCSDIQNLLNANVPKECRKYYEDDTQWQLGTALTGYNQSVLYAGCETNETAMGPYYSILNNYNDYSDGFYDFLARQISPILVVWMPIANAARPSSINYAVAEMRCVKINDFNEGSRVAPTLPAATPVGSGDKLSGGSIAGIVIGILAAIGLLGGAVAWWLLKKKRKSKASASLSGGAQDEGPFSATTNGTDLEKDMEDPLTASTEAPDTMISELHEDWKKPELDAGRDAPRFELDPAAAVKAKPVELEGSAVVGGKEI